MFLNNLSYSRLECMFCFEEFLQARECMCEGNQVQGQVATLIIQFSSVQSLSRVRLFATP